jgi:septum site-determining protein MinC
MEAATTPAVRIRGIREGLLVSLSEGDYEDLLASLADELVAKKNFLQGSRVTLEVGTRRLDEAQLVHLQRLMVENGLELWTVLADLEVTRTAARQVGLGTRRAGSNTDLEGNALRPETNNTQPAAPRPEATPPAALLLKETLRSGRLVYHEGPVIVVGDVNPGAEIIAAGDVIVWGRLRGLVHAGALGDGAAVICALELTPTQLRIADQIAIPPDDKRRQPAPEIAAIRDGQIVAEPWRS